MSTTKKTKKPADKSHHVDCGNAPHYTIKFIRKEPTNEQQKARDND